MEDNLTANHSAAGTYLYQVIKPIVRILIRFGFSARNAADLIRWAYVKVFYETPEFWRNDEPTAHQCSLKTGIQRAEITDLLKIDYPSDTVRTDRRNRAARILSAWINDPDFHDNGQPAELPISSPDGKSFRSLVNRYEADARHRSLLDDLVTVGCVELNGDNVKLVCRTYGLEGIDAKKLEISGYMSARLGDTTEHNLMKEHVEDRRLKRIWWQRSIPPERSSEAQAIIRAIGERAGREIDQALAQLVEDADTNTSNCIETGVVIFGYETAKESSASVAEMTEVYNHSGSFH